MCVPPANQRDCSARNRARPCAACGQQKQIESSTPWQPVRLPGSIGEGNKWLHKWAHKWPELAEPAEMPRLRCNTQVFVAPSADSLPCSPSHAVHQSSCQHSAAARCRVECQRASVRRSAWYPPPTKPATGTPCCQHVRSTCGSGGSLAVGDTCTSTPASLQWVTHLHQHRLPCSGRHMYSNTGSLAVGDTCTSTPASLQWETLQHRRNTANQFRLIEQW